MSVRSWCRLACLVVLAMVAASCSANSRDQFADQGGFVRVGSTEIVHSFNPWTSDDTLVLELESDIYPRLVQYDLRTMEFEPDFASSWSTSADGRTWTFHTHPDAAWSDGKPLTASDVAWTINTVIRLKHGAASLWAGAVAGAVSAKAVDPTTLTVTYTKATAGVLADLQQLPVLPEHVWASYAAGNGKALRGQTNTPSSGHPVVSGGPFTFVKYSYQEAALFQRNPHYYGTAPHVAGFGVELFSSDDALVAAMRAGEIDGTTGTPSIPPTDIRPLRDAHLDIIGRPSLSYSDIIINTNPKKVGHRELLNPAVREALEYATDRASIIKIAYLGYATPGSSIVPPASGKWYDPSVKPLPFDIAKANALLDQAGYARGSDGIRVADGHQMAYTMLISEDNGGEGLRTGQILAADYAKIGIRLTPEQTDDDTLNDALTHDHYRTFDLGMWGWDTLVDPTYILDAMTCSQWYDNSDSGYCKATYDQLYHQQLTQTNVKDRLATVYRMQRMVADDRPYIVTNYVKSMEAWSSRFSDVVEGPDGWFSAFSASPQLAIRLTP
ncbi:MAG TPA: ABC transporter substrate-binding protein [Nocardioides sp.]|uniref:ABC transporter substrate-binding protein n=1 Tax=Nocardioides sp. TaxID=35761 RepID=UPI002E2F50EE|nr:ABC transporter substrate-binding protein [Nocardioides sp.]HEX3929224.1 ABC transporter substrate-binding protein [Nocardioides sp.]